MTSQLKKGEAEQVNDEVAKFLDFISGLQGKSVPQDFAAGLWLNGCYYEKVANGTWRATKCYA